MDAVVEVRAARGPVPAVRPDLDGGGVLRPADGGQGTPVRLPSRTP